MRAVRRRQLDEGDAQLVNRQAASEYRGHFEIVSLTGTVSMYGSHLHISISEGDGKTIGGHLVAGCRVYTTAEIVLAAFEEVVYRREKLENDSGYEELVVRRRQASPNAHEQCRRL